ncbi:MAG TPA: NAD(P)-dependent oxidoreductase [archaeon]|nr:NAD(P)-dependent oxidoreductase [archaeon]
MRIGFVGLGLMGSPMAMHLVRAGLDVAVYNRTALRAEPHREAGAVVCKSLGELGGLCDKIFICVSDTPDVESVIFDPGGLADSLAEGALIVDHSTISPSASRGFAHRLAGLGVGFVDAPVSGGTKGAHEGKLTVMMGGSERDVASARPIVSIYAAKVSHIGPVGSGQLMKCCNQLVAGLHVLALAEGFRFAGRLGLDQATAHEVIGSGAAGSFIWKHWGAQLLEGNLNPGFKISLHRKDLHLVLEECQKSGLDLPGLKLLIELYDRAVEEGLGELGDQALGRVFKDQQLRL